MVWSGGNADYSTELNVAHGGPSGQVQRPDISSLLFENESRSVMSNSYNPTDCSPPGSSVHWILQARTLEWAAMPSSRGSSPPRDGTQVSRITGRFFTMWATQEALFSSLVTIKSLNNCRHRLSHDYKNFQIDLTALGFWSKKEKRTQEDNQSF